MLYTLVLILSVSTRPPAMAIVETTFPNVESCRASGQGWVDASNAAIRNSGAAYVCFAGATRR